MIAAHARLTGWLLLAAALALAPFAIQSGHTLEVIELTLFVAVLGQGWNVLGGYGGQYSFGHALFFGTAALLVTLAAVVVGDPVPSGTDVWRFALVGAIAPGSSQGLFVASIESIGSSRSSVLVSTNPLFSVLLAMVFLDEGWRAIVIAGTLLVVAGGVLISWEPGLGFRHVGVVLAVVTAITFGVRDVIAREFTSSSDASIWWAAAVVLWAATAVIAVMSAGYLRGRFLPGVRRALPDFLPSGAAIAVALASLFMAFDRGRVGLVAPLTNAMQSVVVVALGAVVFGARERTTRILAALVLVGIGGALITGS